MFPCTKCGACCRRIVALAPAMARPDGSCENLKPDNTCAIYETRPEFCRIDESKPPHFREKYWHQVNATLCNEIQEQDDMPLSYRVVVTPVDQ